MSATVTATRFPIPQSILATTVSCSFILLGESRVGIAHVTL